MDKIEFIEKYCLIKKKNNKQYHIKLKDYQIKFIEWYEQQKRKAGTDSQCSETFRH